MSHLRLFMNRIRYTPRLLVLRYGVSFLFVATMAWLLWQRTDEVMTWLIAQESQLRSMQQSAPVMVFAFALPIYFVACFIPGSSGKSLLCGWLLGVFAGTFVINVSSVLAALAMFAISRKFARDWLESRFSIYLQIASRRIERDGGVYLLTTRLVPMMPFIPLNALMGVTSIRTRTYLWATQLGLLPSNFAYAWAGSNLPSLAVIRESGAKAIFSWQLIASLMLIALIPLIVKSVSRRREIATGIGVPDPDTTGS